MQLTTYSSKILGISSDYNGIQKFLRMSEADFHTIAKNRGAGRVISAVQDVLESVWKLNYVDTTTALAVSRKCQKVLEGLGTLREKELIKRRADREKAHEKETKSERVTQYYYYLQATPYPVAGNFIKEVKKLLGADIKESLKASEDGEISEAFSNAAILHNYRYLNATPYPTAGQYKKPEDEKQKAAAMYCALRQSLNDLANGESSAAVAERLLAHSMRILK